MVLVLCDFGAGFFLNVGILDTFAATCVMNVYALNVVDILNYWYAVVYYIC